MLVFLNPGHAPNGNPDPGACSPTTGLRESDVAADVAAKVSYYLNQVGIETTIVQDDSLAVICDTANSMNADLFVSIHCNSADTIPAKDTASPAKPERILEFMPAVPLAIASLNSFTVGLSLSASAIDLVSAANSI